MLNAYRNTGSDKARLRHRDPAACSSGDAQRLFDGRGLPVDHHYVSTRGAFGDAPSLLPVAQCGDVETKASGELLLGETQPPADDAHVDLGRNVDPHRCLFSRCPPRRPTPAPAPAGCRLQLSCS